MKESKYYKKHFSGIPSNKPWLSKILICIILILISLIITNFSPSLKEKFISYVYGTNIDFSKIAKVYDHLMPAPSPSPTMEVSKNDDFSSLPKEEYNGSYKINVRAEYPVPVLASGIIVYNGSKDDYQNTIIIQGNDGIDIWYSGLLMTDYSLYDYVKKDTILGSSIDSSIIITIMKDGKKIPYDEYFK